MPKTHSAAWRTAPKRIGERSNQTRVFRLCDWPPPIGAEPDGYREIRVRFAAGPNQESEWPIGPYAWVITSDSCRVFQVALSASGGTFERVRQPAVTVSRNEIKTAEGEQWVDDSEVSRLPFLLERNEAAVLYNDHHVLDGITCAH